MRIGNATIRLVSDGGVLVDGGGAFGLIPRTLWERIIPPNAQNQIPLRADALLIESEGKRILVDAGLGEKLSAKETAQWALSGPRLMENLAGAGISPDQIDVVINTHLHSDHAGGNTTLRDGRPVPTFPRAEYYIQRLELADARYPNERTRATYLAANFIPLEEAGQLRLLAGDAAITSEVRCLVTPGHTRAHQSVLIESGGRRALFLGDLSTLAIGMERIAWVAAYDVDPLQTIETKRRIRRWAMDEQILLIFMHDPNLRAGYLRGDGESYRLEPADID